ncbi:MAG: pyridoxamine 5'-phosphate oxidase [Ferruginibacter sp.]
MSEIADIRREYKLKALQEEEVNADPILQFNGWWIEAIESNIDEVNAMALATVGTDGKPSVRIVLLKGFDSNGFIFFSNYQSRKASEIEANPNVSLVFFWKELERQIRIEGPVKKIPEAESDAYFKTRPPGSQIGAWSSNQSAVIDSRAMLEKKSFELEKTFSDQIIPRPTFWGGYVVKPTLIEFWQGRPNRLHDRIRYRYENKWIIERLSP